MSTVADLASRYTTALANYLAGDGESALQAAYQVGREALEAGIGPLVLFSIHRDVVAALGESSKDPRELTSDVTAVFVETLAPFQMAYAGLDEARGAVAELSALIQHQGEELAGLSAQLDEVARTAEPLRRLRNMIGRHLDDLDRLRGRLEQAQATADARRSQISSIVSAQEQERRRLAGEIHDDALQAMAAVLIRLGMASRMITDASQRAIIDELEATAGEAIARLRRLLAGLQPPELERAGLSAAVRSSLEQLEGDFAIVHNLIDSLESEPGTETRTIAFRIVQEALVNIRKHAHASQVEVLLETHDDGLLVSVTDDGVGFDVDQSIEHTQPGHLGLSAMRERAELAGGWLAIASNPGQTSVEFWLPDAHPGTAGR